MDQTVPLYRHLRVVDQLAAARALNHQRDADLVIQRLSALGMATSARVGKLSGGQQAQLALTMALARRPRLLLLDEPLASLDPLARQDVLGWLMTCVAEDGLSVVFSSHVIAELERVASYLVVLSAGRVSGGPDRRSTARLDGPPGHHGGTCPWLPAGTGRPHRTSTRSGDSPMTAMTVLRMTRTAWYKHRFSVVGLPAVFLLAALALFADSAVRRHWLSVHHLSGCLAANATTGGSWCRSAGWASFSSPSQTPDVIAAAVLALPVLAGLFAGVPWVAREFESGAFRFTWTQDTGPRHWLARHVRPRSSCSPR